jgi:hypothetical protein
VNVEDVVRSEGWAADCYVGCYCDGLLSRGIYLILINLALRI